MYAINQLLLQPIPNLLKMSPRPLRTNPNPSQPIPPLVQIGAWTLALIVFAIGFWHTHLGLKQMNLFENKYGTIALAGMVLLFMLLGYWYAVNRGSKIGIGIYILCGIVFFTFNLNYIYPAYQGRNLLNEEATLINDSLQSYASRANVVKLNTEQAENLENLTFNAGALIREIRNMNGKGEVAQQRIDDFNRTVRSFGDNIPLLLSSGGVGGNDSERQKIADNLQSQINDIMDAIEKKGVGNVSDQMSVLKGRHTLDSLQKNYTDAVNAIKKDKSDIILDSVDTHEQIRLLETLVSSIDEAIEPLNKGLGEESYKKLSPMPTVRQLGQIEHTVKTIKSRLNSVTTWAMIFICLLIDILAPLGIYLLLRRKNVAVASNTPTNNRSLTDH